MDTLFVIVGASYLTASLILRRPNKTDAFGSLVAGVAIVVLLVTSRAARWMAVAYSMDFGDALVTVLALACFGAIILVWLIAETIKSRQRENPPKSLPQ